ncbi:hypothetical protein BsWGS_03535 [Bradybaena similaris]
MVYAPTVVAVMSHNATVSDLPFELWDPKISPTYRWILKMQTVLEPVIIALGILGNSIASHVFMSKGLRTTSCCLYLAAKCIGDTIFLIALFIVWLHRVDAPLLNTTGICQVTIFITYSCSFTSVWLIVLVSHENYVRIARPHQVKLYCTPRRALISILVVFLSAVVIYHFHLWTTMVLEDDNREWMCMALAR